MSSTTSDIQVRSLKADNYIKLATDKPLRLRDDDIAISSKADGYLDLDADVGIRLNQITTMATGKQLNASTDGVVTKSKAGALSDADFTTDTTGLIAVDTTNNRIYIRVGAASWRYAATDGGIEFPEKTCHLCGETFKVGDFIVFQVNEYKSDGAPHALPCHIGCVIR